MSCRMPTLAQYLSAGSPPALPLHRPPPPHLYSEVFPWILPVEDGHGLKLWCQRVLADERLHRVALTVDDDVRVGSYTASTRRQER